jgi:hypothetical protein
MLDAVYPVAAHAPSQKTDRVALAAVMSHLRAGDYNAAVRVMLDHAKFPRFPFPTWHSAMLRNHPAQRTDEAVAIIAKYLRDARLSAEFVEQFCSMPSQAHRLTTGFRVWIKGGARLGNGTGFTVKTEWDQTGGPWLVKGDDCLLLGAVCGILYGIGLEFRMLPR